MKKIKIMLITMTISFTIFTLFILYITRVQKVYKESNLKSIYFHENYKDIKVILLDIYDRESSDILSKDEVNLLFNTLKNQNIKYKFYNKDNILIGNKFKFRIYNALGKSIDITITPRSITLNGKRYISENNLIELLDEIIENHKTYYY